MPPAGKRCAHAFVGDTEDQRGVAGGGMLPLSGSLWACLWFKDDMASDYGSQGSLGVQRSQREGNHKECLRGSTGGGRK